jgi:TolB protein
VKAVVPLIGAAVAAVAALPFHVHARAVATPFVVTVGIGPPRFNVGLWVVRGRISKRVVAMRQRAIRDPSWSLRGRRLAFTVVRDPVLDRGMHVFVADANGKNEHRLTKASNRVDEYTPAWSPGGRTIAFARSSKGVAPAIWLARSDGRSLRRLTSGWSPAWSPDGTQLVFTDQGVLWTIWRDGSARVQLTQPPTDPSCDFASGDDYDGSPDWSPQGDAIAFVRYCGFPDHTDEDAIYVIRSDGTGLRALTDGPVDDSPSWAPDGRTLAFVRAVRAESVAAAGGPPKTLYSPRKREVYDVAWRR